MNAKKLILLGASAMLLASCGQSLTRAEAIEEMDTISKKEGVTATKLTYVKEWKEENATKKLGKKTLVADGESKNFYVKNDFTNDGKEVKSEAWIYLKDDVYTVAFQDGDTKNYYELAKADDEDGAMGLTAQSTIDSSIANGKKVGSKSNGYGYCGFLAKFPEGEGKIEAGKTIAEGAYIKDESYVKNGDGNLSCSYNAVYSEKDEVMKAEWKDYLLVAKSNAKTSSASGYGFETWDYKKASISAPKLDNFSKIDASGVAGALALTAFLASWAAVVAA